MANPIKFSGRESITSYDFFDLASGTGTEIYYGGQFGAATIAEQPAGIVSGAILLPSVFYSDLVVKKTTHPFSGVSTWDQISAINTNFDIKYNASRIINGIILITVPLGLDTGSAFTGNSEARCEMQVYTVDNTGAETFVISGMSSEKALTLAATAAINTAYADIFTIGFLVSGMRVPSNGKLRVKVKPWFRTNATPTIAVGFGLDPMNRNDPDSTPQKVIPDGVDTVMQVIIPYKLEVD